MHKLFREPWTEDRMLSLFFVLQDKKNQEIVSQAIKLFLRNNLLLHQQKHCPKSSLLKSFKNPLREKITLNNQRNMTKTLQDVITCTIYSSLRN